MTTVAFNPTAREIWSTLSSINVNEHTEDRGGLAYLSWAWAWGMMMQHYPDLRIKWHGQVDENGTMRDIQIYPDGSSMVNCSVTIGDVTREMWLPVMDHRHRAIPNPDSRSISDSRMRCLTKCFALFGLGHYIYAGEDLPTEAPSLDATGDTAVAPQEPKRRGRKPSRAAGAAKADEPESAPVKATANDLHIRALWDDLIVESAPAVAFLEVDDLIVALKAMANDLHIRGWTPDEATKKQISDAINDRDGDALTKVTTSLLAAGESALKLHNDLGEENG